MTIPLFNLQRQREKINLQLQTAFTTTITNNSFTYGVATHKFEKSFAKFTETKFALATNSGTMALCVALKALELAPEDEVITTPMTFSATVDAVILAGQKPIFADIDYTSGNLTVETIKQQITSKTKAVLIVHFAGIPCKELEKIVTFCHQNHLFLIEDASHAHGATYKKEKIGSFGDCACFSLYPSKVLGALGNAGIITTNNQKLYEKIKMYAEHGLKREKYQHYVVGYNAKINNLQAAFLNVKLPLLNTQLKKRRAIAQIYLAACRQANLQTTIWPKNSQPAFYLFSILHDQRSKFQTYLEENGIGNGVYYPIPIHLQPSMRFLGYKIGDFPQAERYARSTISIPIYPELTTSEVNFISEKLQEFKW